MTAVFVNIDSWPARLESLCVCVCVCVCVSVCYLRYTSEDFILIAHQRSEDLETKRGLAHGSSHCFLLDRVYDASEAISRHLGDVLIL